MQPVKTTNLISVLNNVFSINQDEKDSLEAYARSDGATISQSNLNNLCIFLLNANLDKIQLDGWLNKVHQDYVSALFVFVQNLPTVVSKLNPYSEIEQLNHRLQEISQSEFQSQKPTPQENKRLIKYYSIKLQESIDLVNYQIKNSFNTDTYYFNSQVENVFVYLYLLTIQLYYLLEK